MKATRARRKNDEASPKSMPESSSSITKEQQSKRNVSFSNCLPIIAQPQEASTTTSANATFSFGVKQKPNLPAHNFLNISERSTTDTDTVSITDNVSELSSSKQSNDNDSQANNAQNYEPFLALFLEESQTMRIRVMNESSKRSKDLLVNINSSLNLFDGVYNNPAVKTANVRKWGPVQVQQVKQKLSEIQVVVWDDDIKRPIHVFTVDELKETSTEQLMGILPPGEEGDERGLVILVLQCGKRNMNKKNYSLPPISIEVQKITPSASCRQVGSLASQASLLGSRNNALAHTNNTDSLSKRLNQVKRNVLTRGSPAYVSTGDLKIDRFLGISPQLSTRNHSWARSTSTTSSTSSRSFCEPSSPRVDQRSSKETKALPLENISRQSSAGASISSYDSSSSYLMSSVDNSSMKHQYQEIARFPPTAAASSTAPPESETAISLSAANMSKLFPYHIVINQEFKILQIGKDLVKLTGSWEDESMVGQSIRDVLTIFQPPLCAWDWPHLERMERQESQLLLRPSAGYLSQNKIKATITTLSEEPRQVIIICSPDCKNVQELDQMNLTMRDLPLHTFQRERVFLGEHLSSEVRSSHTLNKLSRKLDKEKKFSNLLLNQMLPAKVATDLRAGKTIVPEVFEDVTIFFSDICGFTNTCAVLEPDQIIYMLNQLYTVMDFVAAKFDLYRVKTIGDAYMACSGVPEPQSDHAHRVSQFALFVREAAKQILSPVTGEPIQLRIGIHSGSCIGGIVGNLTPFYDLFGDTVNIASRHESTGEPGKIHCSQATQTKLEFKDRHGEFFADSYKITRRGQISMKGKGEMVTYWIDLANNHDIATDDGMSIEEVCEMASIILPSANGKVSKFFRRDSSDASAVTSCSLVSSQF